MEPKKVKQLFCTAHEQTISIVCSWRWRNDLENDQKFGKTSSSDLTYRAIRAFPSANISPLFSSEPSRTLTNTVSKTTFSPVCRQIFWYIWRNSSSCLVWFFLTGRTRWIPRCSIAVGIWMLSTLVYGLKRWTRLKQTVIKLITWSLVTLRRPCWWSRTKAFLFAGN